MNSLYSLIEWNFGEMEIDDDGKSVFVAAGLAKKKWTVLAIPILHNVLCSCSFSLLLFLLLLHFLHFSLNATVNRVANFCESSRSNNLKSVLCNFSNFMFFSSVWRRDLTQFQIDLIFQQEISRNPCNSRGNNLCGTITASLLTEREILKRSILIKLSPR